MTYTVTYDFTSASTLKTFRVTADFTTELAALEKIQECQENGHRTLVSYSVKG